VNTGHRIVYPFSDDEVKQQIQEEVGIKPEFAIEAANAGGGEGDHAAGEGDEKKLWSRGNP
jgi:hypothetical protein